MRRWLAALAGAAAVGLLPLPLWSGQGGRLPQRVGECSDTTVQWIGTRLEGIPDSGSAIEYANGGTQVSYEMIPGIEQSQVGDSVRLCLESIPADCPPGDDRGRIYRAANLRTHQSWRAMDSEHSCGGA